MNTMQQEFDAVVAHLYKQGRPAKSTEGSTGPSCLYRAPGGLSCAVGCRIPDDKYDKAMDVDSDDGTGVHSLVDRFGDVLPPELAAYKGMFSDLQMVHDGCVTNVDGTFYVEHLTKHLSRTAKEYGLTFTKPEGV